MGILELFFKKNGEEKGTSDKTNEMVLSSCSKCGHTIFEYDEYYLEYTCDFCGLTVQKKPMGVNIKVKNRKEDPRVVQEAHLSATQPIQPIFMTELEKQLRARSTAALQEAVLSNTLMPEAREIARNIFEERKQGISSPTEGNPSPKKPLTKQFSKIGGWLGAFIGFLGMLNILYAELMHPTTSMLDTLLYAGFFIVGKWLFIGYSLGYVIGRIIDYQRLE